MSLDPCEPLLRVEDLSRNFGVHQVLVNVDLVLGRGDRVAICGPNGAGKTTILRCIAGTLAPTNGRIDVCGYPAGSIQSRRLTGISFSQERSFYLRLSGRDNLLFFAQLRGLKRRQAIEQVRAIEQELELQEILRQRVDRCSTGMVQQLALARALLDSPALLLLDEPTRSLDDHATARLWAALESRSTSGLLISTHRADDVARCHRQIHLGS
ncbi:MAG: ABC transporter ATP-binding protein [Actinobacteria bacterium]|nr:ABC transporter ATP-binding protein [Actinomycetota bacterium]